MGALVIAAVLFLGTHLGISSTGIRGALVRATGERGYLAVYSLIAFATLGFLIWSYTRVPHTDFLWLPSPFGRYLAMAVMPVAFVFLLGGFMTRNPTAVGQESAAAGPRSTAESVVLATVCTAMEARPFLLIFLTTHLAVRRIWHLP